MAFRAPTCIHFGPKSACAVSYTKSSSAQSSRIAAVEQLAAVGAPVGLSLGATLGTAVGAMLGLLLGANVAPCFVGCRVVGRRVGGFLHMLRVLHVWGHSHLILRRCRAGRMTM